MRNQPNFDIISSGSVVLTAVGLSMSNGIPTDVNTRTCNLIASGNCNSTALDQASHVNTPGRPAINPFAFAFVLHASKKVLIRQGAFADANAQKNPEDSCTLLWLLLVHNPSNNGRPKRRGSELNRPVQRTLECAGVPQRCGGRDGPPARPAERGRSLPPSGPRHPQACRRGPPRHRIEGSGRCH